MAWVIATLTLLRFSRNVPVTGWKPLSCKQWLAPLGSFALVPTAQAVEGFQLPETGQLITVRNLWESNEAASYGGAEATSFSFTVSVTGSGFVDAKTRPIPNRNLRRALKLVFFSWNRKMQRTCSIFLKWVDFATFEDSREIYNWNYTNIFTNGKADSANLISDQIIENATHLLK